MTIVSHSLPCTQTFGKKILNLLHFKVYCNHLNICSAYVQLLNNHIMLTLLLMPAAVTFTSDSSTPSAGALPNHTAPFMISRHLKSLFRENLFCGSLLPEEPFNHGWLPKKITGTYYTDYIRFSVLACFGVKEQ